MAGHSIEEIKQTRKQFMLVLGLLAILTAVTIWLSFVDWGVRTNTTVGLIIASIKASLVALVFMHLKSEKRLIYLFLVVSAIMFLVCMFMTLLHFADPITPDWSDYSGGNPHHITP